MRLIGFAILLPVSLGAASAGPRAPATCGAPQPDASSAAWFLRRVDYLPPHASVRCVMERLPWTRALGVQAQASEAERDPAGQVRGTEGALEDDRTCVECRPYIA